MDTTYLPIGTRVRIVDLFRDNITIATGHIMSLPVWYRHEDDIETAMHLGYMVKLDSPCCGYFKPADCHIGAILASIDSLELVETAKA